METYNVSKEFILEAHKVACNLWKSKIEKEFPKLFPKKEEVIFEVKYKPQYHSIFGESEKKTFYFNNGDRVIITDGSYHKDNTGKRLHSLGLERPKGTILYNKCSEILQENTGTYTLNLLIQLEDGRVIFSAPNCVQLID